MDFQDHLVAINVSNISLAVFRKNINDFKSLGKKKATAKLRILYYTNKFNLYALDCCKAKIFTILCTERTTLQKKILVYKNMLQLNETLSLMHLSLAFLGG